MKVTIKTEQTVEIANGYYKHFSGCFIFVNETKIMRVSPILVSISEQLHDYEVREIQNGDCKPCTASEFWATYQQTMSTFMLEYHEHVSKGKAADFIAAQSDRAGETPEKRVV